MSTKEIHKVIGLTGFNDKVDGQMIDSGKIIIEVPMDDRKNTATRFSKGVTQVVYPLANCAEAHALLHNPLPMDCELEIEKFANAKGEKKEAVISCRPVSMSKPAHVKAAA